MRPLRRLELLSLAFELRAALRFPRPVSLVSARAPPPRAHPPQSPRAPEQCERKMLLSHPAIVQLLEEKWRLFGRLLFWTECAAYILLLLSFTAFLVSWRELPEELLWPLPGHSLLPGLTSLRDCFDTVWDHGLSAGAVRAMVGRDAPSGHNGTFMVYALSQLFCLTLLLVQWWHELLELRSQVPLLPAAAACRVLAWPPDRQTGPPSRAHRHVPTCTPRPVPARSARATSRLC